MSREMIIPIIFKISEPKWDLILARSELGLGRVACRLARANPKQAGFYMLSAQHSLEKGWRALQAHDEWVRRKQEGTR